MDRFDPAALLPASERRVAQNAHLLGQPRSARVLLATPTIGSVTTRTLAGTLAATMRHKIYPLSSKCSLLAFNVNSLWCHALNLRSREAPDYFAMLHSDVGPQPGWLDTLIDLQRQTGAEVISVILPQKLPIGITSTGLWTPGTWDVQRLTMYEVHQLPVTFSGEEIPYANGRPLVVNTGCMLVDFRKSWVEEVVFTIQDKVIRREDGTFEPKVFPEDWNFSVFCHHRGLKVLATRAVVAAHVGEIDYGNDSPWGSWQTDQGTEVER